MERLSPQATAAGLIIGQPIFSSTEVSFGLQYAKNRGITKLPPELTTKKLTWAEVQSINPQLERFCMQLLNNRYTPQTNPRPEFGGLFIPTADCQQHLSRLLVGVSTDIRLELIMIFESVRKTSSLKDFNEHEFNLQTRLANHAVGEKYRIEEDYRLKKMAEIQEIIQKYERLKKADPSLAKADTSLSRAQQNINKLLGA